MGKINETPQGDGIVWRYLGEPARKYNWIKMADKVRVTRAVSLYLVLSDFDSE